MQSIRLMRYEESVATATDDAILLDMTIPYNGIIKGVKMEYIGGNQIHVEAGRGIIKGRDFEVEEQTIYAKLSQGGSEPGRIIIRLDLANADEPIKFIAQIGTNGELPELIQEKDCNYTAGIYEIVMATYTSEATMITDFTVAYETVRSWGEKILKTREEVEANTNPDNIPSAVVVGELINNLNECSFVTEGSGADTKYYIQKGADTASKKLLGSQVVLLGTVTTTKIFDLSTYDGYKNFELNKNILGCVSGNYNKSTGILTVNQSVVSGNVTVSGRGYVMDGDIRRNGEGQMTGTAQLVYPQKVYLVY